jgi:hypothetical protein
MMSSQASKRDRFPTANVLRKTGIQSYTYVQNSPTQRGKKLRYIGLGTRAMMCHLINAVARTCVGSDTEAHFLLIT